MEPTLRLITVAARLCVVAAFIFAPAAFADQAELDARRDKVRQWRHEQLGSIARAAAAKQYFTLAKRSARDAGVVAWDADAVSELESGAAGGHDGPKLSAKQRTALEKKYTGYRKGAAQRLTELAKWCERNEHAEEAERLAAAAIRLDRHNAPARALAGQARAKGWGWVPADDAANFAKGLVPLDGGWAKKSKAAKEHSKWAKAWEIESDYWRIKSNLELKRLFELKDMLDLFYERFMRDWDGLLDMGKVDAKFRVLIFATEGEYRRDLEANDPKHVKNVPGQYSPDLRRSTFFDVEVLRAKGGNTSSLVELMLHECAHQLFREQVDGPVTAFEGDSAPNFWLHEGIAEYYGMLSPAKGGLAARGLSWNRKYMGGLVKTAYLRKNAGRMQTLTALDALRRDGFMTRDGDQRNVNYAQSGFLCLFLDDDGHRPGFRKAVRALYCGKNEPGAIAHFVTQDMAALQKGFDGFFKGL